MVNGDVYKGEFFQGVKNGKGVEFFEKDGSLYEGEFLEDLPHGQGKLVGVDRRAKDGKFEKGVFVKGEEYIMSEEEYEKFKEK